MRMNWTIPIHFDHLQAYFRRARRPVLDTEEELLSVREIGKRVENSSTHYVRLITNSFIRGYYKICQKHWIWVLICRIRLTDQTRLDASNMMAATLRPNLHLFSICKLVKYTVRSVFCVRISLFHILRAHQGCEATLVHQGLAGDSKCCSWYHTIVQWFGQWNQWYWYIFDLEYP